MKPIQIKIRQIVNNYIQDFPYEYKAVCEAIKDKQTLQNDPMASAGKDSFIRQFAYEIPLTLSNLINQKLDEEEREYLSSIKGAEWFARTWREFSPAERI